MLSCSVAIELRTGMSGYETVMLCRFSVDDLFAYPFRSHALIRQCMIRKCSRAFGVGERLSQSFECRQVDSNDKTSNKVASRSMDVI